MLKKLIALSIAVSFLVCSFSMISFAEDNTEEEILFGDVDGDGKISSSDFLKIKNYLLGGWDLDSEGVIRADFNQDGDIGSSDYLSLRNLWLNASVKDEVIIVDSNNKVDSDGAMDSEEIEASVRKTVTLYVPNENYDGFKNYRAYFDGTAQGIVDSLIKMGALPEGAKVYSFEIEGNTAKIDLSSEFGVALNNARTTEHIFLGSLANTIIGYYGVEYLLFTVEGEVFETGLNVYDSPVEFIEGITMYIPNENYTDLEAFSVYFNGTVEGIVDFLVNLNVLPEGTEVYSFEIEGETAKIDLSSEFGVALNNTRTTEHIFLGSLANTIIDYYDLKYLLFTVEGEVFETGLNVYDSPVEFIEGITVYYPNQDGTFLVTKDSYYNGTIEEIISLLVNSNALPEGTEVYSFEIEGDTGRIDLSSEFGVALNDARTGEELFLGSLVNTVVNCYGLKQLMFTVEGKTFETGLIIYDFPIEPFTFTTIYYLNEEKTEVVSQKAYFDSNIQNIIYVLITKGVLPEGSVVNSFEIEGETAKIDFNEIVGVALNDARTTEVLMIEAFTNTIIKRYGVKYVSFTVEGEVLETGLNLYDYPMEFSQPLTVYVPNEDGVSLTKIESKFNESIESLVELLIKLDVIPEGTEVLYFDKNRDTVMIDLSSEFGVGLNELRSFEGIYLAAFANTVIDYYDVDYFEFTVEGEVLETGLNIYDYPIEFFPMD